jgi:hypothetical protein
VVTSSIKQRLKLQATSDVAQNISAEAEVRHHKEGGPDLSTLEQKICSTIYDLQKCAAENATQKVNQILEVSTNYLSEPNHQKLKMFHELYFAPDSPGSSHAKTDSINDSVDDIFDQASSLLQSGKSEEEVLAAIQTNNQAEEGRLHLAGLQKKLESVISLEEGLREQLAPIISSMQFEDAARQRVEHIVTIFSHFTLNALHLSPEKMQEAAETMKECLAIRSERESFYAHVLHEEPPEHLEPESDGDSFFFDLGA